MSNGMEGSTPRARYKVLMAVADEVFGKAMAEFVKSHTWPQQTRFHLVHVIESNPLKNRLLLPQEAIDEITREEQQAGRFVLNSVARALYSTIPGARVHRHLLEGDARRQILRTAAALSADVIILGSHGRQGFDRFLLGSVANAVVSHAPCSTIVIRLSPEHLKNEEVFELSIEDLPEDMRGGQDDSMEKKTKSPALTK